MKKIFVIMAAVLCMMLLLTGCDTGVSMVTAEDGLSSTITFKRANKGDFVMGGSLEVGEGQKIVIDQDINEGGSATARFINTAALDEAGEDASVEDLEKATDPENYTIEDYLEGSGRDEYGIEPGSYDIRIDVKNKKTTGTVTITVE